MSASTSEASILIVEDSVLTSVAVQRIIEYERRNCRIIRAQSYFEAQLLLSVYRFDLFVIDLHLPDGCGLDLICPIVEKNPNARVLVLTGDDSVDNRDRSMAFGVQHFITKPFRAGTLIKAVRESLTEIDKVGQGFMFAAALERLSVLDVVQLKCLNRASTRLEILPTGGAVRLGTIDVYQGEVIHAEIRDETHSVLAEGREAVTNILGWCTGTIRESGSAGPAKHTITEHWESLLLNTVRDVDERAHEKPASQN